MRKQQRKKARKRERGGDGVEGYKVSENGKGKGFMEVCSGNVTELGLLHSGV